MSKRAKTSKPKSKKHHKKSAQWQYITTPLIYVLISMIVIAPICFGAMNVAIKTVHKAQTVLSKDFNDVEPIMDYQASTNESGEVSIPALSTAQKFGVITCENAGLKADAYYGMNRVSLRNGVAVESDSALCGTGGCVEAYGYASTGFKALGNIKVGDIIHFETLWGVYTYKATEISVMQSAPVKENDEFLVLATENEKTAFSTFNKDKLYVIAEKLTGPNVREVLS